MAAIFETVLKMSLSGTVAAAAVFCLAALCKRFLRCSKTALLLLWAVTAFRLVCPWSPQSALSLFNWYGVDPGGVANRGESIYEDAAGQDVWYAPESDAAYDQAVAAGARPVLDDATGQWTVAYSRDAEGNIVPAKSAREVWLTRLAPVWAMGAAGFLLWGAASYLRLRRKLRFAVKDDALPGVWYSDRIPSPCVAGFFRPRIYLTFGLTEEETGYVLAHERQHIHTGDHIWKALAWVVMCVHWFNPILWVCFFSGFLRLVEGACDQRVLRQLGEERKAEYSQALLTLAAGRSFRVSPSSIAFGEESPKKRVKSILRYRRPLTAITAVVLAAGIIVGVCLITDPVEAEEEKKTPPAATAYTSEPVYWADTGDGEGFIFRFDLDFDRWEVAHQGGTLTYGGASAPEGDNLLCWTPGDGADQAGNGVIDFTLYRGETAFLTGSISIALAPNGAYEARLTAEGTDRRYTMVAEPGSGAAVTLWENGPNLLARWSFDLTHDGAEETVEVSGWEWNGYCWTGYDVNVYAPDGQPLWSGEAAAAHVGQNGIYHYRENGLDYLLEWSSYGIQGTYSWRYRVFSLNAGGEGEETLYEDWFEYDMTDPMAVDTEGLERFAARIDGILAHSMVLASTNGDAPAEYSTEQNKLIPNPCPSGAALALCRRFQAAAQGRYTFTGQVVDTAEGMAVVMAQTLFVEEKSAFCFLVPIAGDLDLREGDQVEITADGPLYFRELAAPETVVEVRKLN